MKTLSRILLPALVAGLFMTSCKKHDCQKPKEVLTDAIITGNDARGSACSGGLMITFTNDPKPYSGKFYDIYQLPSNSGITESTTYPLYVRVKYENVINKCGDYVNILKMERR